MRKFALLAVALCGWSGYLFGGVDSDVLIKRGDANNDDVVNMADASYISNYLYRGGPEPPCMNQADANDDGFLDGADASYIVNWLFSGGPAPPAPGPFATDCSHDPTEPFLGCDNPCTP